MSKQWRCRDERQAKDKAAIYNSREWKELRVRKLRTNPLCEVCAERGLVVAASQVHHVRPIEDTTSLDEMRARAFDWNNLQSLCIPCHAAIHKEQKSHTKAAIKEREVQRQARWHDRMTQLFIVSDQPTEPPTDTRGVSFT